MQHRLGWTLALSDILVLVLATGVGMAGVRLLSPQVVLTYDMLLRDLEFGEQIVPLLLSMQAAIFFLRMKRGSIAREQLVSEPGIQATAGVGLALLFAALDPGLKTARYCWSVTSDSSRIFVSDLWMDLQYFYQAIIFELTRNVGPVIATVWMVALVFGRHRPIRDAIDGVGRLFGLIWIGIWLAGVTQGLVAGRM